MKTIFDFAKLRLTALYLAIIMFVTLAFSFFIFSQVNQATEHALEVQRSRIERAILTVPPEFRDRVVVDTYRTDALLEIREKTLYNLIVINAVILLVSGTLGYYLAGKTLKPVEEMIAKQKRFISDAAHELKTPLTAIKTDIEVTLRDKSLNLEESKETLNRTIEEIDELSAMTARLLAASKYVMVDVYRKDIKVFKLDELINKVVKKFAATTLQKNIEVVKALDDVEIKADNTEIEKVLNNIIDNAIKYSSHDSKIFISLTKSKGKAEIKIRDEGIGISEKNLSQIFDPFYRGDKSRTKSKTEGYGLGLAITKDIVESYGGNIEVTSKPGKGSTFTIYIPILN